MRLSQCQSAARTLAQWMAMSLAALVRRPTPAWLMYRATRSTDWCKRQDPSSEAHASAKKSGRPFRKPISARRVFSTKPTSDLSSISAASTSSICFVWVLLRSSLMSSTRAAMVSSIRMSRYSFSPSLRRKCNCLPKSAAKYTSISSTKT